MGIDSTNKTIFDVSVNLLTPLHIGSGAELQKDFDYVVHQNKTWIINSDALMEHLATPDGEFDTALLGRPASEILEPADFRVGKSYFRYIMHGQPRSDQAGAILREQQKDVFDRPYLPGSSLKGAIRTMVAWHAFNQRKMTLSVDSLRNRRGQFQKGWAGQNIERELFGKDPNHDLLRGLHVADSEPQPAERLQIVNAQVLTGGKQVGAPIELEAIRSDTIFETEIRIDDFLSHPLAEERLQFGAKWQWLHQLPQIARDFSMARLDTERTWYQARGHARIATLYQQLYTLVSNNQLGADRFLIQIGWGGGWESKTIGKPLKKDSVEWEKLLDNKWLSPAREERRTGDEFPKSRRAIVAGETAVAPLGWCLIEMKKRTQ